MEPFSPARHGFFAKRFFENKAFFLQDTGLAGSEQHCST
jgi:hypothetical protein